MNQAGSLRFWIVRVTNDVCHLVPKQRGSLKVIGCVHLEFVCKLRNGVT